MIEIAQADRMVYSGCKAAGRIGVVRAIIGTAALPAQPDPARGPGHLEVGIREDRLARRAADSSRRAMRPRRAQKRVWRGQLRQVD